MKKTITLALSVAAGLLTTALRAQDTPVFQRSKPGLPLTVSVFSHAISLPDFKGFFRHPNLGIRVGTELYYRTRPGSQVFQTLNVGLYQHKPLHTAFFASSEFGYRKFMGNFYADATVGGGYLRLRSNRSVFAPAGDGDFTKISPVRHKFMPTLGLGTGYRLTHRTTLFARYELFGVMPIQQDVPVLPHKALHLGARLNFSK